MANKKIESNKIKEEILNFLNKARIGKDGKGIKSNLIFNSIKEDVSFKTFGLLLGELQKSQQIFKIGATISSRYILPKYKNNVKSTLEILSQDILKIIEAEKNKGIKSNNLIKIFMNKTGSKSYSSVSIKLRKGIDLLLKERKIFSTGNTRNKIFCSSKYKNSYMKNHKMNNSKDFVTHLFRSRKQLICEKLIQNISLDTIKKLKNTLENGSIEQENLYDNLIIIATLKHISLQKFIKMIISNENFAKKLSNSSKLRIVA